MVEVISFHFLDTVVVKIYIEVLGFVDVIILMRYLILLSRRTRRLLIWILIKLQIIVNSLLFQGNLFAAVFIHFIFVALVVLDRALLGVSDGSSLDVVGRDHGTLANTSWFRMVLCLLELTSYKLLLIDCWLVHIEIMRHCHDIVVSMGSPSFLCCNRTLRLRMLLLLGLLNYTRWPIDLHCLQCHAARKLFFLESYLVLLTKIGEW